MFAISPAMHAERIVYWYLKKQADPAVRGEVLMRAIAKTNGINLPAGVAGLLDTSGREDSEMKGFIPDEALLQLKQACVARFVRAAADGILARKPDLSFVLYPWRQWGSPEESRKFCTQLIEDREGFCSAVYQSWIRGLRRERAAIHSNARA